VLSAVVFLKLSSYYLSCAVEKYVKGDDSCFEKEIGVVFNPPMQILNIHFFVKFTFLIHNTASYALVVI